MPVRQGINGCMSLHMKRVLNRNLVNQQDEYVAFHLPPSYISLSYPTFQLQVASQITLIRIRVWHSRYYLDRRGVFQAHNLMQIGQLLTKKGEKKGQEQNLGMKRRNVRV